MNLNYIIVIYMGKFYRPAGYRVPLTNELYISSDGKVKKVKTANINLPRTILRELDMRSCNDHRPSTDNSL